MAWGSVLLQCAAHQRLATAPTRQWVGLPGLPLLGRQHPPSSALLAPTKRRVAPVVVQAASAAASPTPAQPPRPLGAAVTDFIAQNYIAVGLVTAITLGCVYPPLGVAAAGLNLQPVATLGIFVISGLVLQQGEMLAALRAPLALAYGLATILVCTPMLALAIVRLPLQPPEMALGLAVFCCMPTSLSANIALTQACNGNSAVSLLLTVASNLLSVATVPLMLARVLAGASVGGAPLAAGASGFSAAGLFRSLLATVLAPLLFGVAVQSFVPGVQAWRTRNRKLLSYVSTFFLCLVPWMQVSKVSAAGGGLSPAALAVAAAAGATLHVILLGYALAAASVLQFSRDQEQDTAIRKAVVLATAQKTLPIAVSVLSHLGASWGPAVGLAVIPCVVAHLIQTVMDSMLVARWNRAEQQAAAAAAATAGMAEGKAA